MRASRSDMAKKQPKNLSLTTQIEVQIEFPKHLYGMWMVTEDYGTHGARLHFTGQLFSSKREATENCEKWQTPIRVSDCPVIGYVIERKV